jgi:hypothetical protein
LPPKVLITCVGAKSSVLKLIPIYHHLVQFAVGDVHGTGERLTGVKE